MVVGLRPSRPPSAAALGGPGGDPAAARGVLSRRNRPLTRCLIWVATTISARPASGPSGCRGDWPASRLNQRHVLSVLVSSAWEYRRRGHVRESKMRQFGELEAVIMDRLWEWGRPALVREVVDDLNRDRPLAYTTVMTVMENLHRKGGLRRERDGRAWRYEPTGSRSGYTAALMNDALATNPDRRTALTHFALPRSPHDAALLRAALHQALEEPEAGEPR